MSLLAAEERAYSLAESAAYGIAVDGKVACPECGGAGMVPTTDRFKDRDDGRFHGPGYGFVPVDIGVTFCSVCGGNGEKAQCAVK